MGKRKVRSGRGFYVIAAVLLLTVGVVARMSLGLDNPQKSEEKEPSSSISSETQQNSFTDEPEEIESKPQSAESSEETVESTPEETAEETEESQAENVAAERIVTFALPLTGDIIKSFDTTRLQYSNTYGDMRLHCGIDIIGEEGTPVKASADGIVKSVATDPIWGTTVVIEHSGGIETHYYGLNDASVEVNQEVKMSKIVGTIGKVPSECLDESHLHFAMKQGDDWLSPLTVMGLE